MAIRTEKDKFEDLINKLETNRNGMYPILDKIQSFRNSLDMFLPKDTSDFRNRHILQENMKACTEIIKAELDIRKTIESSIKSEIDIRNKLQEEDTDNNLDVDDYDCIKQMSENL